MRFFFDNNLPPVFAEALSKLSGNEGHEVYHLIDCFGEEKRNLPDDEWLSQLAKNGNGDWVIISGDYNIYKKPHLKETWCKCKLTTFFLKSNWMNQKFWIQAYWLVKWWPNIIETAKKSTKGSAYLIPAQPNGKIEYLDSH